MGRKLKGIRLTRWALDDPKTGIQVHMSRDEAVLRDVIRRLQAENKKLKALAQAVLVLLFFAAPGYATVRAATGCTEAEINSAVSSASNGDVVTIPPGTCTWTSMVTIAKAITLKGAGCTLVNGRAVLPCLTTIRDGMQAFDSRMMTWTLQAGLNSRMTGIHFDGDFDDSGTYTGAERPDYAFSGVIRYDGEAGGGVKDARRMRVDHCVFDHLNGLHTRSNMTWGVIDHNSFLMRGVQKGVFMYNASDYPYADAMWNAATNFGGENFLFLEDNNFTFDVGYHYALMDAYAGARVVVRHNTITRAWVEGHGTESGNRARGTRALEVYDNIFTANNGGDRIVNLRSGSMLAYNNTVTGYQATPRFQLNNERTMGPTFSFFPADGTDPWDVNDAGNPFVSETAISGGTNTVTVAGTPLGADYTGYVIKKTSACTVSGSVYCSSTVVSNTTSQITYRAGFNGNFLTFVNGETFTLNKITEVLDQPGRSGGTLLVALGTTTPHYTSSGTTATITIAGHGSDGDYVTNADFFPTTAFSGTYNVFNKTANTFDFTFAGGAGGGAGAQTVTWVPVGGIGQSDDAIYEWNNVGESSYNIQCAVEASWSLQIRSGEHYINDTQKPGYTAYTYPHPLITADATPGFEGLSAPRNLIRIDAREVVRKVVR